MIDHRHIKELISADFDGQTTAEEKKLIEEHLHECTSCRDYARQLNKLSATLDEWDNEDLSPDLEGKIRRGLKEVMMSREKSAVRQHPLFKIGIGGGGVLVAILVLIISMQTYSQRSLQSRVRDAGPYLKKESFSDDIGRQYSASETRTASKPIMRARVRDAGEYVRKDTREKASSSGLALTQSQEHWATASGQRSVEKRAASFKMVLPQTATVSRKSGIGAIAGERILKEGGYQASGYDTGDLIYSGRPSSYIEENKERYLYEAEYPEYGYRHQPDTEEYAHTYESSFLEARHNPLSTFSIDVDTTSYSNIRRFLNNGQLPPADAVRIEEMINYFSYDYPQPGWGKPFSVTTQASHCPWNPQHYLVQIGIKGKTMSSKKVPPSNLVFLIDVSGSMNRSNKLPLLKNAFRMFIDQLSGNERVAIVVYSGSASVVLDSTPGSDKWRIQQAIDNLSAGGSTAGAAGIHLAYDIARRNFIKNGNNRVILATDGDFNVGVSSDSELVRLIESKRDNGIFLSILGFGTGNYKDAKMEQIANKGNGNYFYIDSIKEGRKVLVDELGSTLFTIAKDVKLQVEFNPAEVKAYKLIGYENRALANQDFNDDTKDAGELGAGHTVTAFYEVIPAVSSRYTAPGVDSLKYQRTSKVIFMNTDLMTVKLRYKDPQGSSSKLIKKTVHRRDITNTPGDDFQFASAVAEFGLLLRNSPYRAGASYDHILMRARRYQGADKNGHKTGFANLVEKARSLDHRPVYPTPVPYPYPYPEYNGTSDSNINFKGE